MISLNSILIADDHCLVRKSFILTFLEYFPELEVTEAANGREVLDLVEGRGEEYDLVVLDINMPVLNGISCLKQLREDLNYYGKVIFISVHSAKEFLMIAKSIGANGYFTKNITPELLISGLERVFELGMFVSSEWFAMDSSRPNEIVFDIMKNIELLSNQEAAVLKLLTKGFTTGEVAETLCVTKKSVDNYKNRIAKKMVIPDGMMFQDWVRKNDAIIELFV